MREELAKLQSFLDDHFRGISGIDVLEAGCGSISYIRFQSNDRIVGMDISEKQLERNTNLHEKILGDIQNHDFRPDAFDMIVCWDVLEHLAEPLRALENFLVALKRNGVIVLALPNLLSLKGLLTKYTPHWLHVFFYRFVRGWKDAGTDGKGPFKTYFRCSITPNSLRKFASRKGLDVIFYRSYSSDLRKVSGSRYAKEIIGFLHEAFSLIARLVSMGRIGDSEFLMVLRK